MHAHGWNLQSSDHFTDPDAIQQNPALDVHPWPVWARPQSTNQGKAVETSGGRWDEAIASLLATGNRMSEHKIMET